MRVKQAELTDSQSIEALIGFCFKQPTGTESKLVCNDSTDLFLRLLPKELHRQETKTWVGTE